jgi:hypothetical protein
MNDILLRVQRFLDDVNFGRASVDEKLLDEYAARSRFLLSKKLNEKPRDKFYLRPSNIGRPLCQLWMEKSGASPEAPDNFFSMKMLFGDCIETLAIVILKSAGIEIQSEQIVVSSPDGLTGSYDVEIEGKIWDIKSTSNWAFNNKFRDKTIQDLYSDDAFGYVAQIFAYASAVNKPVGGWICINKETGEWTVLEANYDKGFEDQILDHIENTKKVINSDAPFKRCFDDVPEIYYKAPTGNRILHRTCSFCSYKSECWPDVTLLPSLASKAKNRPLAYYTHIANKSATQD